MLVPTIGIEVHAELKTKAKVFSTSLNDFNSSVNNNVTALDLALPGTLPKINREVVNLALKAAIALNCKINMRMHFDRKNYFYPDLPKGYQITQKDTPIGYDGYIEIIVDGVPKKIEIERIHIEEDTCKSMHSRSETLLNFNRSGVPLVEIVTKPVIKNEKEAVLYLEALRETLLYAGVSDVKMEEGSMRCEANVSLKEEDSTVLGTKVEIKNIGSISNVASGIKYEIKRQKEIIESGSKVVEETRRFDDKTGTTILMRKKEIGNQYRYMPEPDIPFLELKKKEVDDVRKNMPVLPSALRKKYMNIGINDNNIKTIIGNQELCFFLESLDNVNLVIASNLLTGDVLSYLNKMHLNLCDTKLTTYNFSYLVRLLDEKSISSKQAKEIIVKIIEDDKKIDDYIKQNSMEQINDEDSLMKVIEKVTRENQSSVNDYKNGHERAIKYLMGMAMKETGGKANPKILTELLINYLNSI